MHLSKNPICRSVATQRRIDRSRSAVNARTTVNHRNRLLGRWVGRDVSSGSDQSNHPSSSRHAAVLDTQSRAGSAVGSSCQAQRGDGSSFRFSRQVLTRRAKRTRANRPPPQVLDSEINDSMSSLSMTGSNDIECSRSHQESDDNLPINHVDDCGSMVGSAEAAAGNMANSCSQSVPPPSASRPGDVFHRPMSEVVLTLPHLTPVEAALAELYNLLDKAGAPLELFDTMIKFIEKHLGSAFVPGRRLQRRDTFLKNLKVRFVLPDHENVPVTVETGNEPCVIPDTLYSLADSDNNSDVEAEVDNYRRSHFDTIIVPRWSFEDCLRSFLLDPFLFGNVDNLVNKDRPFKKYVSRNPNDTELLSGRFYSDSYDLKIADPSKELLVVIDMYLDKTGKSAGITSSCGEPLIWTTPLLSQKVRENHYAWNLLGFIADLETGSSAKKRLDSGRVHTKGRSLRNYHKVLATLLEGLVQYQQSGGKYMHVQMGDEVRYMKVIIVVGILSGDAKSGDAICARYGGKNCLYRVSRWCMTGFKDLDDYLCACFLVRMCDLETLYKGASNPRVSAKERKKYRDALKLTSSHYVDNAFFQVDFGSNQYGVTAATASDMMHLFESGIIKRVLNEFTTTMSTAVKADVDALIEKLFVPIRSSKKKDFPRMNFKGGATSLTMLSSHHWPGMTLSFLTMLLTPEGREICNGCFQDEDMVVPEVEWDKAPPFDMNRIHVPKILINEEDDLDGGQESATVTTDSPSDDEVDNDGDDCIGDDVLKNRGNAKAVPLPCSHSQFVTLLEDLLVFHAWYKCGAPPKEEQLPNILLSLCKMVHKIVTFCPRNDGNKWKLQKLHELLHLPLGLYLFVHSQNFDASRGERLLKDFFKRFASRSQERGRDIFITQVAKRAQEKLILDRALLCSSKTSNFLPPTRKEGILSVLPKQPSFQLNYSHTTRCCVAKWLGNNKDVMVHPMITTLFGWKWKDIVGRSINTLSCYTEYCAPNGTRFRAHPNYNTDGSWYDWGLVRFEQENRSEATDLFPCRVLFFYRAQGQHLDKDLCGIHVVVESTTYRNKLGNDKKRKACLYDTRLCSRWQLSDSKPTWLRCRNGQLPNAPSIFSVPVECLDKNVLVIEEEPGLKETYTGSRYVWVLKDCRGVWPGLFDGV